MKNPVVQDIGTFWRKQEELGREVRRPKRQKNQPKIKNKLHKRQVGRMRREAFRR